MHWRKWTWALLAWTALMGVWLIASASATATSCPATGGAVDDCSGYVGIAVGVILFIWLAGAAPLSIIWYATRGKPGNGEARWGGPNDPPPG